MAEKWEVELDSAGIQALLKSPEIKAECLKAATTMKSGYGPGYEIDTYVGKTRVNAMIKPKGGKLK